MSSEQTLIAMQRQIVALQAEIERLKTHEGGAGVQTANTLFAGPASGSAAAPAFRALTTADLPGKIALLATGGVTTPTDDFEAFNGWSWSSDGSYDGAPSTIDATSYPSHVVFVNDSVTEDHFAYLSGSKTTQVLRARLFKGMQSYIGLRLSTADEATYIEVRLEDSAAATGLLRLVRYQNGLADAVLVDYITPGYVILELGATSTGGFWYGGFTTNAPLTVAIGSGGWATTIARWGITFGQRGYASDYSRACGVDWILASY